MIDIDGIRRRDEAQNVPEWLGMAERRQVLNDRHDLLAYVDELREAAGKVTCFECEGDGYLDAQGQSPCPWCADLRALLTKGE